MRILKSLGLDWEFPGCRGFFFGRNMSLSVDLIKKHEGLRLTPYLDSVGILTIGYGRNLEDNGISDSEAETMLVNDLDVVRAELNKHFTWYADLNEVRQAVMENMLFNLGLNRFMGFINLNAALYNQDYEQAAVEMLDSKWAGQVKGRAVELAEMMRTGEVS